jgi:hypothetical protein
MLGSRNRFGHFNQLAQSRLEFPHSLVRIVHYHVICFCFHPARLPLYWRLILHVPLFLLRGPAREFIVGQPLANDLSQRQSETPRIADLFVVAVIVPEGLFIKIPSKVERLDADVGSLDATLQKAPEILKAVGVNPTLNVLDRMIYNLMVEVILQSFIRSECIAVHRRPRLDLILYYRLKSFLLSIRDYCGPYLSTTAKEPEDSGLVFYAGRSDFLFALCEMHVACLPTDEGFVNLNLSADLPQSSIPHCQPHAVEHKPRCLLRDAKSAREFIGTDTVLAVH